MSIAHKHVELRLLCAETLTSVYYFITKAALPFKQD